MGGESLGFVHRYEPGGPLTLLLAHGTGGNEESLLPWGRALAPGAGLLSPRGKVLERGMPRFFRRLSEGVFDHQDLVARTHELSEFLNLAAEQYRFDPGRVFAVGFSNGANIAGSLLLLHPGDLKGAILFRPMVPFEPPSLPDLTGRRILVGAGRRDPLVPPAQTERLVEILGRAGAEVVLRWSDGGHDLGGEEVEAAAQWLSANSPAGTG